MRNSSFRRSFFVLAFTVIFFPVLRANGNIRPVIDVAQFKDSNNNTYLEIYYSVSESGIMYKKDDSGNYACQLVMDLVIHLDKKLWTNKVWKIEKAVADTASLNENSNMVDVLRYFIEKPGSYEIVMHIKDMQQAGTIDSVRIEYVVRSYSDTNVEISDLQMATDISKSTEEEAGSSLVKNNYKITPVPAAVFGSSSPNIYYYFEAYNLQNHVEGDKYKSVCKVLNSAGDEMAGLGLAYRTKMKKYDTSMEIGMLNISNLPSGKYNLVYGIADNSKTMLASKQKLFYIFNPDVPVAAVSDSDDPWPMDELTEKELDLEFEMQQYLYDKKEKDFYANLNTVGAKKTFIKEIWQRLNEENLPPVAFREQYLGRAKYADSQFSSIFGKGWKSDRGRILILYGIPSNVERFAQTESTVPYQVWTYDKLGNQAAVEFVFADIQGFNKYELMHSDYRGERYNPEWKSYIFRGSNEKQFR